MVCRIPFSLAQRSESVMLPVLPDSPTYTLQEAEDGYVLTAVQGLEAEFNILARQLLNSDSTTFSVFPQSDAAGHYHTLHIIPHARD